LNRAFNGALKWRFTDNFQTGLGNIWRSEQRVIHPFVPAKTRKISLLLGRLTVRTVAESVGALIRPLVASWAAQLTAVLSSRRAASAIVEGR
jgi:hypothetical protein